MCSPASAELKMPLTFKKSKKDAKISKSRCLKSKKKKDS